MHGKREIHGIATSVGVLFVGGKMIVAFDIDGTIANNDHREHLAQAKKWDEFHALGHLDKPLQQTLNVLMALDLNGDTIELWTARPERYRQQTFEWLQKHHVVHERLLMRPDGDWRKAYILKLEWYLSRSPARRPGLVFEDHPETTRLLRLAGACVHQVGEGHQGAG